MITQAELFAGLKNKLSKADFNIVMDIFLTSFEDIKKEYDNHIKKSDYNNLNNINGQIKTFTKIKCNNIFNKEKTVICKSIISELKKESEEISGRITANKNGGRNMRRYVVGGPKTTGKTGD